MSVIDRTLIREAPKSTAKLLRLLRVGLHWQIPNDFDDTQLMIEFTPEELHLDPSKVAKLKKIQQLPKLDENQDFAAYILSFTGGSLPQGAIRRLVARLVSKKRASRGGPVGLWGMEDIMFFCVSDDGVPRLHIVSFRETHGRSSMKVISWSSNATENQVTLLADRELRDLVWGESGIEVDARKRAFVHGYRYEIRTANDLAQTMAEVAKRIKAEVGELLAIETEKGPLRSLRDLVKKDLRHNISDDEFADMYAQTMVYGLLAARVAHPERFVTDANKTALSFDNPFLDSLYSSFRQGGDQAFDVDEFGLRDLAEVLALTDVEALLANFGSSDYRDDPVVFFYQDFLDRYDPKQRKELGTYYTPIEVVRFMVRAVDAIIKSDLGLPLGVADSTSWREYAARKKIEIPAGVSGVDPVIRMLDPATGTGTFLLEWIRRAKENLRTARAESDDALRNVLDQTDAFEISLSSYAVAHLKTGLELSPLLRSENRLGIKLTDSLAGRAPRQGVLFDDNPIAAEGAMAEKLKFEVRHSVVLGNPPYLRTSRGAGGGWLVHPVDGQPSLFDQYLDRAMKKTAFGHTRSLFNLYTYFWRFAKWKVFEQFEGPGVVAFITASSWLTGPGFLGMRELARELADDVIVVDLGGDNLGARPEENIFPIQTPVAIVFLVRRGSISNRANGARVRYLRIEGTRAEKLTALSELDLTSGKWVEVKGDASEPLAPRSGGGTWNDLPALADIFPMQQPGCKWAKTWPHSPSKTVLPERWKKLLSKKSLEWREKAFVTGKTGRKPTTKVGELTRLADLPVNAQPPAVERYAYRSFDRQWALVDERISDGFRPTLWANRSDRQIFLATTITGKLGFGPAATASIYVPDYHHFNGRGGKDLIPLYRDSTGTPNIDPQLLQVVSECLSESTKLEPSISAEQMFAYVYAILASTDYTVRFRDELTTPGPRIPIPRDFGLFEEVSTLGETLLWLQTFGERCRSESRGVLSVDSSIRWTRRPSRMPADNSEWSFDPDTETLSVADGRLTGVVKDAWDFEVSGMPVIKKWLGYRTAKGAGKAASSSGPLDQIRPTEWESEWSDELREIVHVLAETEKLRIQGKVLLNRIMGADLVISDELPPPPDELRRPPSSHQDEDLFDGKG